MFKNLKLSGKIALMIAAVALPLIAATLYTTIKGFNKDINFARQELKGNAFQRPLQALLEAIPRHAWLAEAAAASGEATAQLEATAVEVEIDQLFGELEVANDKHGAELQFTAEGLAKRKRQNMDPRSVKAVWNKLKTSELKGEEIATQHASLVAAVRTMITHVGDTSNLILDPDLDSYYLMDATLVTLPQTLDRLTGGVSRHPAAFSGVQPLALSSAITMRIC